MKIKIGNNKSKQASTWTELSIGNSSKKSERMTENLRRKMSIIICTVYGSFLFVFLRRSFTLHVSIYIQFILRLSVAQLVPHSDAVATCFGHKVQKALERTLDQSNSEPLAQRKQKNSHSAFL